MSKLKPEVVDVMIDLETLGKKPGCVILSIGACTVDKQEDRMDSTFYSTIAIPTSYQAGLTSDLSTLQWWHTQDLATRNEAFSGIVPVNAVLLGFASFLGQFPNKRVWGNAASFDLKILEAAYEVCAIQVPWTYREEMCYRTVKQLFPNIPATLAHTEAHNALDDACFQAAHLELILSRIQGAQ